MCSGFEAAVIGSLFAGTAVQVQGQRQEKKARKQLEAKNKAAELDAEGKRKESLVTRERSIARNVGTAQAARQTAQRGGAGPIQTQQTLGSSDLFKRTLG